MEEIKDIISIIIILFTISIIISVMINYKRLNPDFSLSNLNFIKNIKIKCKPFRKIIKIFFVLSCLIIIVISIKNIINGFKENFLIKDYIPKEEIIAPQENTEEQKDNTNSNDNYYNNNNNSMDTTKNYNITSINGIGNIYNNDGESECRVDNFVASISSTTIENKLKISYTITMTKTKRRSNEHDSTCWIKISAYDSDNVVVGTDNTYLDIELNETGRKTLDFYIDKSGTDYSIKLFED